MFNIRLNVEVFENTSKNRRSSFMIPQRGDFTKGEPNYKINKRVNGKRL